MAHSGFYGTLKLGALALVLFVMSGCLGGGGSLTNLPTSETALVKMKIRLGRVDNQTGIDPAVNTLNKAAAIEVEKLFVTFISNLGDTVRDTVRAVDGAGGTPIFLADSVMVNVNLRALRWWNVEVETRDRNDSIIHKGAAGPFPSKGGQKIDLTIPQLDPRFLMYEAQYQLPDHIFAKGSVDTVNGKIDTLRQKIYFHRLLLEIDESPLRDSNSFDPAIVDFGTRFIPADTSKLKGSFGKRFFKPNLPNDTATHVQVYEYIKAGTYKFKMSAFGYLEGDSVGRTTPRLLYQGSAEIGISKTGSATQDEVQLDYKGPGSGIKDTVNGPNWNGLHIKVTIGRVKNGGATITVGGGVNDF